VPSFRPFKLQARRQRLHLMPGGNIQRSDHFSLPLPGHIDAPWSPGDRATPAPDCAPQPAEHEATLAACPGLSSMTSLWAGSLSRETFRLTSAMSAGRYHRAYASRYAITDCSAWLLTASTTSVPSQAPSSERAAPPHPVGHLFPALVSRRGASGRIKSLTVPKNGPGVTGEPPAGRSTARC